MRTNFKILLGSALAPVAILPMVATSCNKAKTTYSLEYFSTKSVCIPYECIPEKLIDDPIAIDLAKGTYTFTLDVSGTISTLTIGALFYLLRDTGAKAQFTIVEVNWNHKNESGQYIDDKITDQWSYDSEKNVLSLINGELAINYGTISIKITTEENFKCIPTLCA